MYGKDHGDKWHQVKADNAEMMQLSSVLFGLQQGRRFFCVTCAVTCIVTPAVTCVIASAVTSACRLTIVTSQQSA